MRSSVTSRIRDINIRYRLSGGKVGQPRVSSIVRSDGDELAGCSGESESPIESIKWDISSVVFELYNFGCADTSSREIVESGRVCSTDVGRGTGGESYCVTA